MSPFFHYAKTLQLQGSLNILRVPPGETSLTTMPSPSSPDYRVSHEEDRRQQSPRVHCGRPGQQASEQMGYEEAL